MTVPSDRSSEFEQVAMVHAESLLRLARRMTRNHHAAEDAVQEALGLWEERERNRAQILASLDHAEASLARGEGREITEETMRLLAADVKQRGRARLAAERA